MPLNAIELTVILLLFATLGAALAPRIKLPTEVLLLLSSLLISLIPGLPTITLDPEIVFLVFLPPILFYAAYFTSWRDFKRNLRSISLLAIGLVLFTTLVLGFAVKQLLPELPWAHAFLLGAIVSPPDASAATSLAKKLGIPRRVVTIIEGESLVNDATALVCFRFAVAAILTGAFSYQAAALRFLWASLGGVVTGLVLGSIGIWLFKHLKETRAETVISLLLAMGSYIAAEHLEMSGVISTVAAGLYFSRKLPAISSSKTRMETRTAWDILLFVINGLVFTLIGLQLPSVVKVLRTEQYSFLSLVEYAAITSAVVIVIRIIWVFPATYLPRVFSATVRRKSPTPNWRAIAVLSWTGMRGIVSLAAALSIPKTLPSGATFPYRDLLIFLSYSVILATLLLPSLTLPYLIQRFELKDESEHHRDEALARIATTERVLERLEELSREAAYSPEILKQVHDRFERRLRAIRSNVLDDAYSELIQEDLELRRIARETIESERLTLHELRVQGKIHDEIFHLLSEELDLEDLRLRTTRF